MESKSIHLVLNTAKNNSRVLKFTKSLIDEKIVNQCIVVAMLEDGLQRIETIDEHRTIIRLSTPLSKMRAKGRLKNKSIYRMLIAAISLFILHLKYYRFVLGQKNVRFISCHIVYVLPISFLIKRITKAALIYQPHELETETNGLHGLRKRIAKIIEKNLIKMCDLVFVVTDNIADWYMNEYNIIRPFVVKNVPMLSDQKKMNLFRTDLGIEKDSIILLYQGALFEGRGINLLLNCFKNRDDNKVVVVFMGYGDLYKEIIELSKIKNNIFFYSAVAPEIVLNYTSSADIGISFIENISLSDYYCLPNKLFEYAMAGLPVIVSNLKEMKELVEYYDMGIVVDNESVEGINNAIDEILTLDIKTLKQNARRCAEENAWENQQKVISEAYRSRFAKLEEL